ncbi:MAG TPA: sigma-54 dependent transcriptional regulator [Polyangia bacterium]|nr:sigma-54 dependent transcriptional regulator [Polyangia bacterium]
MRRLRALIVDDVIDVAQTVANELDAAGFDTEVVGSGGTALERFTSEPADVVVTDLRMQNVDGMDVLRAIKRADPGVPVLVMTAFGDVDSAVEAMASGAFHYLTKPFAMEDMLALVERACRERILSRENAQLREALHENASSRRLLGKSPSMQKLRAMIERVAGAGASVLISGETGSGKELVALAIHADSPRGGKPFVAVNCAALPEYLLESELFGHAKGAFTGAAQSRRGLFVEADGGTIFLDEIGDLPPPLQGKLLRVLQSGEVRPVGSETSRTVDVRCVAATHKDLAELVAKGLFREDLFFRLDVLRVPVPPLRDRREDVVTLAEHFLKKSLAGGVPSILIGFEPAALDFLAACEWPGNVRQLENVVHRLVVSASAPLATLAEVKAALGPTREADPIGPLVRLRLPLQEVENRYIEGILKSVDGSRPRAAEILGVDPSTLYRRDKPRRQ